MTFLSSKLVLEVENIFKLTLQPNSVRAGQAELAKLREKPDFQLALANFLSRSTNHNHRIFAALQLQKRIVLRDIQTVLIIKETYFRDIDKIADILTKIILHDDNFRWADKFLTFPFDQMGVMESVRYIRLLFKWLSLKDKALKLVNQYFDQLVKSLAALAEIAAQSQDSLFMLMVTLSMFLETALQLNIQAFCGRIDQLWMIFDRKCKFYGTQNVDLIKIAIQEFLYKRRSSDYPQHSLFDLIISLLSYQSTRNQLKLQFQSRSLQFILKHAAIFPDLAAITELITAFNVAAHCANQDTLAQSSFKTLAEINNKADQELLGKEEETVRSNLCWAIEQIFERHYQLIAQHYREQSKDCKSLFLYLLPLVNYYNSTRSQAVRSWVTDHLEIAFNHLGDLLSSLKFQPTAKLDLRNECVGCLQMLVKYKLLVPVKMMPHIVGILQEISAHDAQLSFLCYLFMGEIWEELALLDFTELADFILKHLRQLNANEWDHCLQSYSCFLNLAQHLEEHYQFYSHLIITDDLVLQSIRAQEVMVGSVMETPRAKLNFELINKLLLFTSYLLGGLPQASFGQFHQGLRIGYLARMIQEHALHSLESARILAFEYVVTGKIVALKAEDDAFGGLDGGENNTEFVDQISEEVRRLWQTRKRLLD